MNDTASHPPHRGLTGSGCLRPSAGDLAVPRERGGGGGGGGGGGEGLREDPLRVQEANQQLRIWWRRHRGLLLVMTAASAAAAAAAPHRSPGDAPLLDALRDRNAAAGMFVNETARGWFSGDGIMMQPCRS